MFDNMRINAIRKQNEKLMQDYEKNVEYIFTVSSGENKINDFALMYFKDKKQYAFQVQTMISYNCDVQPEDIKAHLQVLLYKFTVYMIKNELDIKTPLTMDDVFDEYFEPNGYYNSIEEAYQAFKILVNGYCSTL